MHPHQILPLPTPPLRRTPSPSPAGVSFSQNHGKHRRKPHVPRINIGENSPFFRETLRNTEENLTFLPQSAPTRALKHLRPQPPITQFSNPTLATRKYREYNTRFGKQNGNTLTCPERKSNPRFTAPATQGGVFAFIEFPGNARIRPDTPSARTSGRHETTGLCTALSGCQPPPSLTCPPKATPGRPRCRSLRPAATFAPLEVS